MYLLAHGIANNLKLTLSSFIDFWTKG